MLIIAALFGLGGLILLYGGYEDYRQAKYIFHQQAALIEVLIAAVLLGVAAVIVSLEKRNRHRPSEAAVTSNHDATTNVAGIVGVAILAVILGSALGLKSRTPEQAIGTRYTPVATSSTEGSSPDRKAIRELAVGCEGNKSEYCNHIRTQDAWYQGDAIRQRFEQPKQAVVVEITNAQRPAADTPKAATSEPNTAKPRTDAKAKRKGCTTYFNGELIGTYHGRDVQGVCMDRAKLPGFKVVYH